MPKNNVNPDHYKVAGRERPGEDIPQAEQKQSLAKGKAGGRAASRTRVPPGPDPAAASPRAAARKRSAKRG
jgi:hypothetical protein